jgi:hypothetical protein
MLFLNQALPEDMDDEQRTEFLTSEELLRQQEFIQQHEFKYEQ